MESLAKLRNVIICGNSSSVVKEAPFYGAHALNIGIRQTGRESSRNQKDCLAERKLISQNLSADNWDKILYILGVSN